MIIIMILTLSLGPSGRYVGLDDDDNNNMYNNRGGPRPKTFSEKTLSEAASAGVLPSRVVGWLGVEITSRLEVDVVLLG